MKREATIADELAARLGGYGLGEFIVREGRVLRVGDRHLVLDPVAVGRGRPSELERALGKSSGTDRRVFIADDYSPGALRMLQDAQVNYVDRRRIHVRLASPELSIHVEEVGLPVTEPGGSALLSLAGAAGAVVLALLDAPHAEHRVTVLAEQARVSPATAQKVLFGLEESGLLVSSGRGPNKVRVLTDPATLLDRYAADAAADRRLAVRCRVLGDGPLGIAETAAEGLGGASISYALTGAVAALIEAPALTNVSRVEMWVSGPRTPEYLLRAVDGLAANEGANLVLWRATTRGPRAMTRWQDKTAPFLCLASRFRVYADLLTDPQRGREQAEVYRDLVIGF